MLVYAFYGVRKGVSAITDTNPYEVQTPPVPKRVGRIEER